MPMRAMHPCAEPGCVELVREGQYCAVHFNTHSQQYNRERGSAAKRGYGARWQRVRRMFLAAHPVCEDPYGIHVNQVVLATDVDHIVPKAKGGGDGDDNLQALCHACHSRKTAKEDGRWG